MSTNGLAGPEQPRSLLRRIAEETGQRELSLLDIGAGLGDVPQEARRVLAKAGINLRVTLLDRLCVTPAHQWHASHRSATHYDCRFATTRLTSLSSSLFAHHFEPDTLPAPGQGSLARCQAGSVDQRSDSQPAASRAGVSGSPPVCGPYLLARRARLGAPLLHAWRDAIDAGRSAGEAAGDNSALPVSDGRTAVEMKSLEFDLAVIGGGPYC